MTYRDLIRRIEAAGWHFHRQQGSHMVYRHRERPGSVVVAGGGKLSKDVPKGTEVAVLRQAGLRE